MGTYPKETKVVSKNALMSAVYSDVDGRGIPFLHDVAGRTIWGTQQQIADAFAVTQPTVAEHLENLFREGELDRNSVHRKFRLTASDGKAYQTSHYNHDAIFAVGGRVRSDEAKRFRAWQREVTLAAVIGRTDETSLADEGLKRMLVAIFQQNADTQRSLTDGHNALAHGHRALTLVVNEGFDEVNSKITQTNSELHELSDAVALLPRDDREDVPIAIKRTCLFVVEKRFHGLCPACNDREHPLLLPGPLHGGSHWATQEEVGIQYRAEFDHRDNVGTGSLYAVMPLHHHCHVNKHRVPMSQTQPQFDNWIRVLTEEVPPRKKLPWHKPKLLI